MTDYTDLIARLRFFDTQVANSCADALEAQARRIAELEKMLAVHRLAVDVDALKARIAELEEARDKAISFVKKQTNDKIDLYDAQYDMRQRIAELIAALKPFATLAELEDTPSLSGAEQWFLFGAKCVTFADLRAARAALGGKE